MVWMYRKKLRNEPVHRRDIDLGSKLSKSKGYLTYHSIYEIRAKIVKRIIIVRHRSRSFLQRAIL